MSRPVGRLVRSMAFGGLTRLPKSRWRTTFGRLVLEATERLLAGGEVTIAGGAAGGLRLDTSHLNVLHPHAYGLLRGVLEPSVQEALRRSVAPGMTVYDIGSDVGFFALIAAHLTGAEGRVEAFEPVPESAAAIEANVGRNGFSHVSVHRVAVGADAGDGALHVRDTPSWSHLADRGEHGVIRQRIRTRIVQIDEEIAEGRLRPPDVIKLDVEGSEHDVLRGAIQTLRRHRPVVVCELHDTNAEISELMRSIGYSLENLDGTERPEVAGAVHVLARGVKKNFSSGPDLV